MNEQNRHDNHAPAGVTRRQLLSAFGIAGAALAAQSVLSFQSIAAQSSSVTGSVYGTGASVAGATYGPNGGGPGYPPGQALSGGVLHLLYESVAAMQADTSLTDGLLASTAGYYEPGDGGGANYTIGASALPEDGGGVIALANGLQALLLPGDSIRYKQFGAVCDGTNDDGVQIKKAHAYANEKGLSIVNRSGEYWIKATNEIAIKTNVDWGHTKFHIDESFNTRTNPRFRVTSRTSETAIVLDAAAKASMLSKLKPGTTLISELAPYKNCLVFVVDRNDKIGVRYGYDHNGWDREEFFYVEEHGRLIGDIAWTFKDYTSLVAYPCDDNYLIIDGGTFYLSGTSPGAGGAYLHNGILVRRSRTVIRNQWVGLEPGASDVSLDPRQGFYFFSNVFDVTLDNVRLIPWEQDRVGTDRDVPAGTYGIGGSRVLNATFRNVTAEGSDVHWGVFGTNLFKNFRIEGCRLNRVDVHFHCWNLYVKDSEIGYKGFTLTGGGDLFIENTRRFGTRFIDFRNDYGAKWDGNIRLTGCRLVLTSGTAEAVALYSVPANFDYKYPIGYGRSIKIDDFIFDYTGVPNPTGICRIMKIASFSKITATNARLFFPSSIEFSNVIVVGREKGVRILEIANPLSYDLGKPGGYDADRVTPNCYMRFAHIQGEKVPPQTSQSTTHVNFLLNALGTASYDDANALYPKINIVDCGDFFGHFKGAVADVHMSDCTVNCIDAYEGGPMRGKLVFASCRLRADAVDDGKQLYSLSATHGVSFIDCTIHAPVLGGVERPDLLARYDFIQMNNTLRYNHLGTKLAKSLVDYFANAGTPVEPEFYAMLKSHHESESVSMAKRKGTTAERPAPAKFNSEKGYAYFDTDLGEPVVWDGARWVSPAKAGDTLHFYAPGLPSSAGTVMKRAENHPSQEYVLPQAGSLVRYAVHVNAPGTSAAFTFDLLKNGSVWVSGIAGPSSSANPKLAAPTDNAAFQAGDRLSVRIAAVDSSLAASTYATVDLYVSYVNY
ncbi:hypothetical protein ACFQI7_30000 [Paenibacillus allorhizosphaerae]|uniref:Pectate lyase superfamily protein domain-containing protein n=1 Tax=Paenibacillus allorhizosphaerae TaxID=2849866 RepID=A0ABN7TJP4_9BACL|nr:hypothetical protein [Paenibacillus allorhizosphaerae]CAG7639787.1 hypothetical protein PAECIP111802_02580 [Paenibacillus allorhizosphaerae]